MALWASLKSLIDLHRAQSEGYSAWRHGDLDLAAERLGLALERRPGAPEVLLPLARALAEKGDAARAFQLLDEALHRHPGSEGPILFRALLLYDQGEMEKTREEVSRLRPDNLLGRALPRLAAFAAGEADEVVLPPGAVWLSEIAGRLLALLEERAQAREAESTARFHHSLFHHPVDSRRPTPPTPEPAPGPFKSRSEWRRRLEELFAAGRFQEVCLLSRRPEAEAGWKDLACEIYHVFSLLHSGQEGQAASLAEELLRAQPRDADLHFLKGLASIKAGLRSPAAWCFVRAARIADVELNHVLWELARRLHVPLREGVPGSSSGRPERS